MNIILVDAISISGVMVSYVDKHIGHDMEIKHIRLLKEDRMAIAEMMSAG